LENGANGSFVYQIADEDIQAAVVAEDPIGKLLAFGERLPNPAIPAPNEIFAGRRNSAGLDLTDPVAFGAKEAARAAFRTEQWEAKPILAERVPSSTSRLDALELRNPADATDRVGRVIHATPEEVKAAIASAAASNWPDIPVDTRAEVLRKVADLYEANSAELFALLAREAGKIWADAVAEVREAVDFLRY
jgi:RHH-type proline utilization regulon transcriptional repressor/proline dehydrogenase/delta 1-pyrroline-5-carboxylate dehydrogenase